MKLNSVYINPTGLYKNEQLHLKSDGEGEYLKSIYQQMNLEYPKFYKMDRLSKMAFLAVETLLSKQPIQDSEQLALVFANRSASEETDQKFIASYSEATNPSPALFVYTLPNIVTGELAIRHKWYGENTFFITPEFDAAFMATQIQIAFLNGNSSVLVGWTEANSKGKEECFVFLIEAKTWEQQSIENWIKEIKNRYNNYHHE